MESVRIYPFYIIHKDKWDGAVLSDPRIQYRLKKYGGNVKLLVVECRKCEIDLFRYQQDGDEPLTHCYEDRIMSLYETFNLNEYNQIF